MKRRTGFIALIVVVVLAAVAGVWIWRSSADDAGVAGATGPSAAEIVAAKRAQRSSAPTLRGPASASGRVTAAADGASVVGALVFMSPKDGSGGVALAPGERGRPLLATTDASGDFRFVGVPPGSYALSASAKGLLPSGITSVVLQPDGDERGLDVALTAGGHRVAGSVVDIVGGPVDGASVRALRLDEGNTMTVFSRAPSATLANEEGRYELWLPDGAYVLTAEHPDYVAAHAQLRIDGGPRSRDITLTPGAAIEGQVVTRAGEAVPGALVSWASLDAMMQGGNSMAMGMTALQRVVADDTGHFRVTGLEPGIRSLTATAPGAATLQPVEVPLGVAEEVTGVQLVLDRAFTISGFVVHKGGEAEGLENVMLSAWSVSPPSAVMARGPSEADGYFEILGVQPGTYFISAMSDRALPSFMSKSITVTDSDVDDVLLELGTGVHVRGRVEPAVAASLTVEVDMKSLGMMNMMSAIGNGFIRGRAGDDGTFDLFPLAGAKVSIIATTDDGRKGRTDIEIEAVDLGDVVVTLEPHARLAGQVVDAGGAPVEGVEVQVTATAASPSSMSMSFDASGSIPGGGEKGVTDETGHYSVRGLSSGTYEVRVNQANGPALAWAEPADPELPTAAIEVTLAEAEQREDFTLRIEARDGIIRGTVVGADGEPIADAWVRATREQSSTEYTAQITAQFSRFSGGPQKEAKARKPEPDAEAKPQQKAASRAMAHRFAEPPVLTDEAGRFTLDGLRQGTYLVIADGPRGSGRGQANGVALGSDVKIEVEPLGAVEGVVTVAGSPATEYTLTLQGPDIRSRRVVDPAGRFTFDRLDPGEYEIRVEAKDGSVDAEVEVLASKTASVKLELEAFATLRGKLVDTATGEPIAGMNVAVQGRAADPSAIMSMFGGGGPKTDDDGNFSVDRIQPGSGSISFLDPDGSGFSNVAFARYEVEAGSEQDLGTINGLRAGDVAVEDRGELGLSTSVVPFAKRPLAADADEAGDDGDADDRDRLWVSSVAVDGPAQQAGVEPGDEIVSIRSIGVEGIGAGAAALSLGSSHVRAGDDIALEIGRDGMTRSVTVRARSKVR